MIGYVHGDFVHARFMRSVLDAQNSMRVPVEDPESGPNLSGARNRLVERFLRSSSEWLFMVDTDVTFPCVAITQLLQCGEPIISGLIHLNSDPPIPMMYRRIADSGPSGFHMAVTEWSNNVEYVDAVGTGCLLVYREVFERIRERLPNEAAQWFQETQMGSSLAGEDFTFCMRATQVGYKIAVATHVRFGHIKSRVI